MTSSSPKQMRFTQLQKSNGSWDRFLQNWTDQTAEYGEDFEYYAQGTIPVLQALVDKPERKAGVFALETDDVFEFACQINTTTIPGYTGPVCRVRFITMAPLFDLGDEPVEEYARVLVMLFHCITGLTDNEGPHNTKHIKFHLRSPAERVFFTSVGQVYDKRSTYDSVEVRGSWLYVTKA